MTGKIVGLDFEDAKERKLPGIEFRERYDVLPAASCEFKVPDLLSARGNQRYSADRSLGIDNDIQRRPLRAFEEG